VIVVFSLISFGRTAACKKNTRLNYSMGFGIFSWFCVLDLIHFPLNLSNNKTIKIIMCENEQKPEPHS